MQEVSFNNGDIRLAGLYFRPAGEAPHPAVVFIRGSGPSSRNSYWARSLAEIFVQEGVAVLLPDKRGSDESQGDWRTANFDDLAGDAVAAVEFLQAYPGVRADKVGVAGLSQGGKIAPVAATMSDQIAFVVNFSGAATSFVEQVNWEMYHTYREAGVAGEQLEKALTLQILAGRYVRGEADWRTYEQARQNGLQSSWKSVAEGFPATQDAWQWDFFRAVGDFDPLPYWRRVKSPVIVFYGENDHNAPAVRSAYRLGNAFLESRHRAATVRILAEAGHGLWAPESAGSHRPELHPELEEALRQWISDNIEQD